MTNWFYRLREKQLKIRTNFLIKKMFCCLIGCWKSFWWSQNDQITTKYFFFLFCNQNNLRFSWHLLAIYLSDIIVHISKWKPNNWVLKFVCFSFVCKWKLNNCIKIVVVQKKKKLKSEATFSDTEWLANFIIEMIFRCPFFPWLPL